MHPETKRNQGIPIRGHDRLIGGRDGGESDRGRASCRIQGRPDLYGHSKVDNRL